MKSSHEASLAAIQMGIKSIFQQQLSKTKTSMNSRDSRSTRDRENRESQPEKLTVPQEMPPTEPPPGPQPPRTSKQPPDETLSGRFFGFMGASSSPPGTKDDLTA